VPRSAAFPKGIRIISRNSIDDGLRACLLDGLPPRVKGMAEAIVVEWEAAVAAVPELERLAVEDVQAMAALPAEEREDALRRRWSRLHEMSGVELTGRPQRRAGTGRTLAAH
jgi:hypothetical protein